MRQLLATFFLCTVCSASAVAGTELDVIHDSGHSVPLAPYVAQLVGGPEDAAVVDGLRFPFGGTLKPGVLQRDGLPVFSSKWLTQPVFVVAADELSMRWVAFNHSKLIQLNAVGVVVQAASPLAFKSLQRLASPLHLAPDTGAFLASKLGSAGAGVFPLLVHSDGRAFQILPQDISGGAQ